MLPNFILNYTLGNWGEKFFANAFLMYSKNHDFFSTRSFISQNITQSEKIIINDRDFITFSSNIDQYFKSVKSNLKLMVAFSQVNFKNIVNDSDLRAIRNNGYQYGFELHSAFRGLFNYHFGSKWNHNQVKTIVSNSFTDNTTFLDLSLRISDIFNIKIQSERYYFGNLDKNNNTYYFLDLDAKYVLKPNKLTLSISGNNLFNTKTFRNYSITDINISKNRIQTAAKIYFTENGISILIITPKAKSLQIVTGSFIILNLLCI